MFRKISATVLIVQDLERCMQFYRDILGLEVVFSDPNSFAFRMEGQDFLLLDEAAAAQEISEAAVAVGQGAGRRVMLCVGVDDVNAAYEGLTAKGVSFIKPPIDQPWGRRTTYFADPEGNLWEMWQMLEGGQAT